MNRQQITRTTVRAIAPLPPFAKHCDVHPQILRGIDDRCPLRVTFHHEILLDGGVGARASSCAPHLFEAAAGLLKAVMQAGVDPDRVTTIVSFRVGQEPQLGSDGAAAS